MARGETPSGWRIASAILPLPFIAVVVVPGVIVAGAGARRDLEGAAALLVPGLILFGLGLAVFVWTVRLFATTGRGTLAPWDPPERLVVAGPYRHVRHPMIMAVALMLAGETLVLGLAELAAWLGAFVLVNALYLPLVEEPRLVRRFGPAYELYMANVRRWIPRLSPWDPHQMGEAPFGAPPSAGL